MQQPPSMMPVMSSLPPATITTEQIQKYLDENKKLILAILDNQNLGKLAECAQYQAQLQKNLMYLAAIADAQPQMAALPAQVAAHPTMQPGAYYVQHPQAAAATAAMAAQPPGFFPPRMPAQFSAPHQLHEQAQPQHQQALHGQLNVRPAGPSNGMTHTEGPRGGGTPTGPSSNKQDGAEAGPTGSARCAGEGEETK